MTLEGQRLIGPFCHHLAWQRGCKHLYVVLAYLSVNIGKELAGVLVGEGIEVHLHVGFQLGCGGFYLHILERQLLCIHSKVSTHRLHIEPTLLLEAGLAYLRPDVGSMDEDAVGSDIDIDHGDMTAIEALRYWLHKVLVVLQAASVPVEAANLIYSVFQTEICGLGCDLIHLYVHGHCVTRHVERQTRMVDIEGVNIHLPVSLALGGVLGNGVAEGDIQLGTFQLGNVHLDGLSTKVDAMTLQIQSSYVTLDTGCRDEVHRVHLSLVEFQGVDFHLSAKQGQQGDIDNQPVDIGNGIGRHGGLDHLEAVDFQIQRESQAHIVDRDLHTGLLGCV